MQPLRIFSKSLLLSIFICQFCFIGCSQFIHKPLSDEYLAGYKLAETYAKQDAIDSRCINYPVSIHINIINNTRKHISNFKEDKSTDFVKGFSKGYKEEYQEYMHLYCDNLDSTSDYIK
ncbi:MAG: hypothetical protein AB7U45_04035 [Desulfamplus sp.]